MSAAAVRRALEARGDPSIAAHALRFFRTGEGEYGEGDRFLGIRVPVVRQVAQTYAALARGEAGRLLRSPFHEARLCALLILVRQFERGSAAERAAIYALYVASTRYVNGWDLVDTSAHRIVGAYLENRSRRPLYRLARSASLWERRIAIMATLHFIRRGEFDDTLALAERLLADEEDLIHKAVGWMLREVGNRDRPRERQFLQSHCARMPRTMLRYAIEKFPERERKRWVAKRSGQITT